MTVIFILNRSCKQYNYIKNICNKLYKTDKQHNTIKKRVQVKLNTDYIKSRIKYN